MSDYYSGQRLKRSLYAFLAGKLGSGVLGFLAFAMLARVLAKEEFGAYVAAMAFAEIVIGLSIFGVDWVSAVFLPTYRIRAPHRVFWRFVARMAAIRAVTLGAFALLAYLLAGWIAPQIGLDRWMRAFELFLVIAWLDGMLRFVRDTVMDSLLMQWASQLSVVAKNIATVSYLGLAMAGIITVDLVRVAGFEIGANAIALVVIIWALALARHRDLREQEPARDEWVAPSAAELFRTARNNYMVSLLQIAAMPNVVALAIERHLGFAATAVFGFARMLVEQVRKYLPSELFFGIIRTMILASHEQSGDLRRLAIYHSTLLKAAQIPVSLVMGAVLAFGESIVGAVGGAKYADAHSLLLAFTVALALFVVKRNVELFLNSSRNTGLMVRSAAAATVGMPLALLALWQGGGLLLAVGAMMFGEACGIAVAVRALRSRGIPYRIGAFGMFKIFVPALLVGLTFRQLSPEPDLWRVAGWLVLETICILLIQYLYLPFGSREREVLRRSWKALRRSRPVAATA